MWGNAEVVFGHALLLAVALTRLYVHVLLDCYLRDGSARTVTLSNPKFLS